jgi:hypothetical protein
MMNEKNTLLLNSYSDWQNFDPKFVKDYERIFIQEEDDILVVKDLTNEYHVGAKIKKNHSK